MHIALFYFTCLSWNVCQWATRIFLINFIFIVISFTRLALCKFLYHLINRFLNFCQYKNLQERRFDEVYFIKLSRHLATKVHNIYYVLISFKFYFIWLSLDYEHFLLERFIVKLYYAKLFQVPAKENRKGESVIQ